MLVRGRNSDSRIQAQRGGLQFVEIEKVFPATSDSRYKDSPFEFLSDDPSPQEIDTIRERLAQLPRLNLVKSGEGVAIGNGAFEAELAQYIQDYQLSERQVKYLKGIVDLAISFGVKGETLHDPVKAYRIKEGWNYLFCYAGRRRVLATYMAGSIKTIPVVIEGGGRYQAKEARILADLTTNLARETPPIDGVVLSLVELMKDGLRSSPTGYKVPTQTEIAAKVGVSRKVILPQLRLAQLLVLDDTTATPFTQISDSPWFAVFQQIEAGRVKNTSQLAQVTKAEFSVHDALRAIDNLEVTTPEALDKPVEKAAIQNSSPKTNADSSVKFKLPKHADATKLNSALQVLIRNKEIAAALPPEVVKQFKKSPPSNRKEVMLMLETVFTSLLEDEAAC